MLTTTIHVTADFMYPASKIEPYIMPDEIIDNTTVVAHPISNLTLHFTSLIFVPLIKMCAMLLTTTGNTFLPVSY